MNKKVLTIVSCLLILAISVTLLLIILVNNDKKNDDITYNNDLTCTVNDIDMLVGDKLYDFYNFNKANVEVSFELDKVGVIYIDEEFIEALSTGEVNVTITGIMGDEICYKQFIVTVTEEEFYVKIIPVLNCRYDDDETTIYMEDSSCHFNVEIYNEKNNKLDNVIYDVSCKNENAILEHGLIDYILITNEDCDLVFEIEHFSTLIKINVVSFES